MKITKTKLKKLISESYLKVIRENKNEESLENKLIGFMTKDLDAAWPNQREHFNTAMSVLEGYAMAGDSEKEEVVAACNVFISHFDQMQKEIEAFLKIIRDNETNRENNTYSSLGMFSSYSEITVTREMRRKAFKMKFEIQEIVKRRTILMDFVERLEGRRIYNRYMNFKIKRDRWFMPA